MINDNPVSVLNSGWLSGAVSRCSQAVYHECNDYDAEQCGDHGRPRGPAGESSEELLANWLDGTLLFNWWLEDTDIWIQEMEQLNGQEEIDRWWGTRTDRQIERGFSFASRSHQGDSAE